MITFKNKILLVILLSCFLQSKAISNNIPASVEITSPKVTIDIGEPLILKLTYKFEEPQMNAETGDIHSGFHHSTSLLIELKDADNDWLVNYPDFILFEKEGVKYYPLELQSLNLNVQDEQGLEYSGYFLISYNHYKKGLTFDEPGKYRICMISTANKIFSNVVDLQITSQMQEEKCALLDPNGCDFLMGINRDWELFKDPNYRSKTMVNLKNIVEQCPDSLLSKLAAARIGLESFYDYEIKRTEARREKREPSRQLYQEAKIYLQIGLELPDDFLVRQEILYRLIELEEENVEENKNFSQALSYLNELGVKYPKGKYGKTAASGKAELLELQELQERELGQSTKPLLGQSQRRIALPVVVAAVAVGIVLIGLILVLKKRPSSRSK
jgi:hypothetical protein